MYIIEYAYEDGTLNPSLTAKSLIHRIDGQIGSWDYRNLPEPRPRAEAFSSGGVPVAEWHDDLYPEGVGVLSAQSAGAPYLILPMEPDGEIWRPLPLPSISISQEGGCADRLDYTPEQFRLWICLAPHTPGDPNQYALVELPRTIEEEFEAWKETLRGPRFGNGSRVPGSFDLPYFSPPLNLRDPVPQARLT